MLAHFDAASSAATNLVYKVLMYGTLQTALDMYGYILTPVQILWQEKSVLELLSSRGNCIVLWRRGQTHFVLSGTHA